MKKKNSQKGVREKGRQETQDGKKKKKSKVMQRREGGVQGGEHRGRKSKRPGGEGKKGPRVEATRKKKKEKIEEGEGQRRGGVLSKKSEGNVKVGRAVSELGRPEKKKLRKRNFQWNKKKTAGRKKDPRVGVMEKERYERPRGKGGAETSRRRGEVKKETPKKRKHTGSSI